MANKLFFGDCLDVLRNEIADESVALIYLDPPLNSNRNYNLLFRPRVYLCVLAEMKG
jgi:site-specific DNA-methyltransferase (adenine-specific)